MDTSQLTFETKSSIQVQVIKKYSYVRVSIILDFWIVSYKKLSCNNNSTSFSLVDPFTCCSSYAPKFQPSKFRYYSSIIPKQNGCFSETLEIPTSGSILLRKLPPTRLGTQFPTHSRILSLGSDIALVPIYVLPDLGFKSPQAVKSLIFWYKKSATAQKYISQTM